MSDTSSALQASITIDSPQSDESSGINSKFKTLKKKIRNKFRLSRKEDVKTFAQAVETLKRSDELLTAPTGDTNEFKNEFKGNKIKIKINDNNTGNNNIITNNDNDKNDILELKETLESIINQNQILVDVVKSVDSACPDPFKEPEKFSVYFAQRSLSSNRSFSEEDFDFTEEKKKSNDNDNALVTSTINVCEDDVKKGHENCTEHEMKNALLRLQNLRSEEQRGFQIERENYESRLGQLSFLQQEIEILRKQNSEHQIQFDFLAQKNNKKNAIESENENLKCENEKIKNEILNSKDENEKLKDEIESFKIEIEELKLNQDKANLEKELIDKQTNTNLNINNDVITIEKLSSENDQLKNQLELTLLQLKSLQEISENQIEKDQKLREISEENVRLKIEFEEVQNKLLETERQICDLEVN